MSKQENIYNYSFSILSNYDNIKGRILDRSITPFQIEIHPPPKGNKLCWLHCPWCYGKNHNIDPSIKISFKRLIQLTNEICNRNPKVKKIIFSGVATDPLFSDIHAVKEMVEIVKHHEIIYGIHTKLLRINPELINLITVDGIRGEDYLCVSLDAGTPETYCTIHKINDLNLFNKILDNIKAIIVSGDKDIPKVIVTYLLQNDNCDANNILKVIGICNEIGIHYIRFSIPQLPYSKSNFDYKLILKKKLNKAINLINKEKQKSTSNINIILLECKYEVLKEKFIKRVIPCFAQWIFPTIGIDGYLYPCCQVATSEFKEHRIADLKINAFWEIYYNYNFPQDCFKMSSLSCKCDRKSIDINSCLKYLCS